MKKKKMRKPHKSVAIMMIAVMLAASLWAVPIQAAAAMNAFADINKSVIDSDPITTHHNSSTIEQLNTELKILEETLSSLEENAVAGGLTEQEIAKLRVSKSKLSALDAEIKKEFSETEKKIEKIGSSNALKRHGKVVAEYTTRMAAIQDQIASISETRDRRDIKEKAKKLKEEIQSFTYKPEYKPLSPKLPHRIAEPTKKKPYTGLGIVPAYYSSTACGEVTARTAAPTSDDLADTIDANQTQEIKDLAAELDYHPVRIYEYVRNNINYELYYGSRKGSAETLKQLGGNDFDQASLLIALYRTSGIPARYVYGTIDIPIGKAMNWVGVKDNETAGNLLATAGVPTTALISGGEIVALRIEHVWVEAYVPYANYREVPISGTGEMWIPLDPSFKQYNYKGGLDIPAEMDFDANTFLNDYISTMHSESPIELYVQNINDYIAANHPNLTYDDVIRTRWIEPEWLGLLPASLPYTVVAVQEEYSEIPDNLRDKVRFYIHDDYGTLLDYTARMPEIAGKRVTISYVAATPADQAVIDSYGGLYNTPPYLVDLKPVLKVAGNDTAIGTSIGMGLTHYFNMGFTSWQGTDWIENYIISGNYLAVGLDTQSVSDRFLYPEVTDNESFAGEKLYRTAMDYLDRCDRGQRIADETMQMVTVKEISDVIASNDIKVSYWFGQPQTFEWKGLLVDADRCILGPFSVTGDANKSLHYMILTGMEGSISENRVFEDNYDVEAISGIKALEIASDLGIQVYDINSSNIGAILPALSLPSSVKADIQNAVNKGWVVKVPAMEFAYKNWTGVGWIKMDPITGAAGYMISGITSGGQTVQTWPSDYHDALTSPNVDYITANIILPPDDSIFVKGAVIKFIVQYTVHYDDSSAITLSPPDKYVADTSEDRYVPGEYRFYAGYGTGASIKFYIIKPEATIVELSTDKEAYKQGETIAVTVKATTNSENLPVTVETNLYNTTGVKESTDSSFVALHKGVVIEVSQQLYIDSADPHTGMYTVDAVLRDNQGNQLDLATKQIYVGEEPDFYITTQDIVFSQINTVPGGLEVSVDASIHYENDNVPRDVDVKFYDEDINTGGKTVVHSETMSMSPGVNTVSIVWATSSHQHRLCVVVDPSDKIKEANENNNIACKSLDGRPTIDDVKSEYIGTFLVGIPIMNRFDVFVDWGEGEPDKVIFELNEKPPVEVPAISDSPSASHEYDMGFDIRVWPEQNVLKITAINTDGGASDPFILSPKVVPIPTWLGEYLGFEVIEEPHVIIYKKEVSFPEPPFKGIVTVPDWIPHVNGKLGVKDTQAKVDAEAKTDGSGSVELSGQTGFAAMQQEVLGGVSGRGDIELDALHLIGATFKLFIQGVLKKEVGVIDAVPTLKSAEGWPVVGHIVKWFNKRATIEGKISPRVDLQANFKEVNEQLEFVEGTGSGTLPMLLTLTLEAYERLRASVYGGGTPSIDLQVPEKPPLGYLKKLSIRLLIGLEVQAWIFHETFENVVEYIYPDGYSREGTYRVYTLSDNEGGMQVLGRDYAKTEYAVFAARDIIRHQALYPSAQTQETLIVSNVFPLAEPSIDVKGDIALLVWVHDDINKPIVQGEEIYYSLWNGTIWSVPSAITNDNNFDFSPTVKFNSDGDAIAIWERNKNESLDENITLDENFTSGFEIAYSVFNSTTSSWSNTSLLTNNSYLDFGPILMSDKNNNIVAIWIANEQNILSSENSTLYYSLWNNTAFTSPSILKTDDSAIMRDFAYKDGKLIYVWTQDKDGNFSTAGDEEIYYSQWNGTWSVPIQITNDSYDDEVPSVLYDNYGNAKLLWLKRVKTNATEFDEETNTTYNYTKYVNKLYQSELVGDSWTQESLVRNETSIINFEITSDADDNIVLVWVAMGINGSDMFYSVYDSNHSSWSTEYQLTADLAMEETITPVFDSNNTLVASYLKVEVLLTNRTIIVNDAEINMTNIPEFGNSSLYVLRHVISKDLSISNSDIQLSTDKSYPGDTVTINATVHNVGDLSIDAVKVAFFDGFNGSQIGATQIIDTIHAGANVSVSVNWTVPLTEQSHEIYVKVDPLNEIAESNESNNIASVSTVLPDLIVNWTFVGYSTSDRQVSINTSIKNNGTISASNIVVEFYYSNYTDFNESALIKIGTEIIDNIGVGDGKEVGIMWDVSAINRSWYGIYMLVDPNNAVQESDESNNGDTALAKVLPDLTLNASDIKYSNTIEGNVSINITVHNKGIYDAENITLSMYNGSPTVNSSTILANRTISLIRAHSSSTTSYEWSALPGMYNIYVLIDPDNFVDELDESNNLALNPVIITPGADLMLNSSDIIFSDANETGHVSITATIHNIGSADVLYTTVQFYNGTPQISGNPYITDIPNLIGTMAVSFIPSGGSTTIEFVNWVPMEGKAYDIYVGVDPNNNVHETNESNNMAYNTHSPYIIACINITVNHGWNLISVPLNLTSWELGNESLVGDPLNVTPKNSLTSIYRYNTTSGLFEKCDHFDDWGWWQATGSESFTKLEPGKGYWVMAKNDCNLTFTGTAPSDINITLNNGWNLIGWYSMEEALLGEESVVGDPLNVTPKNSLSSIYRYNTTKGEFEKCDHFDNWGWWQATGSESFTELEPGRGYWVMAKNDCVWRHEA